MLEARKASISLFYSIVLFCLIIFCFSMVDITRIQIAQVQNDRALHLATKSAMASYDSQLAREYGLFGYEMIQNASTESIIRGYQRDSLITSGRLNGYQLGPVEITEESSILDTAYIEDQVMSFMKYRGPYIAVEEFLKDMDLFSKATYTAKIINQNNEIASGIEGINANYVTVEKMVDGIIVDNQNYVLRESNTSGSVCVYPNFVKKLIPAYSGHNPTGIPDLEVDSAIKAQMYHFPVVIDQIITDLDRGETLGKAIVSQANSYVVIESMKEQVEDEVTRMYFAPYSHPELYDTQEAIDALYERIKEKEEVISNYRSDLEVIEVDMADLVLEITSIKADIQADLEAYVYPINDPYIEGYEEFGLIGIHNQAIDQLNIIQGQFQNLAQYTNELKVSLYEDSGLYIDEVRQKIEADVAVFEGYFNYYGSGNHYAVSYYSGGKATCKASFFADIRDTLSDNVALLESLDSTLISIKDTSESLEDHFIQIDQSKYGDERYSEITSAITSLTGLSYNNGLSGGMVTDLTNLKQSMYSYKTNIEFDYLPFTTERATVTYEEVKTMMDDELGLKIPDIDTFIEGDHMPSEVLGSGTLYDMALPDSMSFASAYSVFEKAESMASGFVEAVSAPISHIYLNEYIYGMFSGYSDGLASSKDNVTLTGIPFKHHCFESEIEYILFGHEMAYKNVAVAMAMIYVFRVLFNCIHILTSPDKLRSVTETAEMMAGWWSLELAVPPLVAVMVFFWSAMESVADLKDLMLGDQVALLKNETQWQVEFDTLLTGDSLESENLSDKSSLMWGYKDYLRLMLYLPLTDKDTKIARFMDLIQFNMTNQRQGDLYLKDYVYSLEAQSKVKVPFMFMSLPFMPDASKGQLGGYSFETKGHYCYQ